MNKVKIELTYGNINNNSIYLRKYKELFPIDSFGANNKSNGVGKELTLHIAGLNNIIKTDIAGDKMVFRKRTWCGEFFDLWNLSAGDWIIINKIRDYEYVILFQYKEYSKDFNEEECYLTENGRVEVSVRLKQGKFRRDVLKNFEGTCCLSGISENELIVASHIIPWKDRKETRLDPANGLSLSVMYDKLFDKGYISFDENLRVIIMSDLSGVSIPLKDILLCTQGKTAHLPVNCPIKSEYLEYHRINVFKG